MKVIPNPICPSAFVGKRIPIDESRGLNTPFHVEDGTAQIEVAPNDPTATPAERAMGRKTIRMQVLPPPPYAITEDTTILGGIFRQEEPHTPIFNVAPGVQLVIQGDGQYVNCTLPDEAEIVGFPNLSHGFEVETGLTGEEDRKTVRLLCECEACCAAQSELEELRGKSLAEEVALGARDAQGRRVHAKPVGKGLKSLFRERRKNAAKVSADRTRQANANLAALQKWNPAKTLDAATTTRLKRGQ